MPLTRRQFHRRSAAAAGLLAGCAAVQPEPSLDALARAKGLRFGSTLGLVSGGSRPSRFDDEPYRALTARECSVFVAENETKWPQLCPDPRQPYQFEPADRMFAWAASHGMALRGHALLWMADERLPAWLKEYDFGARPAAAAERLLAQHVSTTCQHFGSRIESWDVVNEAVDPKSGRLRQNVLSRPLGGLEQVELAFRLAREYAPHAQLVYNDFMNWGVDNAAHRRGVLQLLAELRRRGAPVQALGVQAHIGVWQWPPTSEGTAQAREWRRFLDEVTALGLDILVTEFDVNDQALPADPVARDWGVAALAREWLDVTLDVPRLNRLLCWGLADRFSWLQDFNPRPDAQLRRCLPYDAQLRPKPLRSAIASALRAMAARTSAS